MKNGSELKQTIRSGIFKGQCIRSIAKWIEEGEKPTKFFLSLESRNYIFKQIPRLQILLLTNSKI